MNLQAKICVKKGEFTLQETLTYLQEKETLCFRPVVIDAVKGKYWCKFDFNLCNY